MYELDYDIRDIKERKAYEKYLCEKSSLLGMICEKRGLELFNEYLSESQPRTEFAVEVYSSNGTFEHQLDVFSTQQEAERFKNICNEPLSNGEYVGILAIHYNENENECSVE